MCEELRFHIAFNCLGWGSEEGYLIDAAIGSMFVLSDRRVLRGLRHLVMPAKTEIGALCCPAIAIQASSFVDHATLSNFSNRCHLFYSQS